ncbi:hypothetical protein D3C85_1423370 [compost metagenome]
MIENILDFFLRFIGEIFNLHLKLLRFRLRIISNLGDHLSAVSDNLPGFLTEFRRLLIHTGHSRTDGLNHLLRFFRNLSRFG